MSQMEKQKYIKFRMRCGRIVIVPDTPQYRESAKRMGWVEIKP